MKKNLYFKNNCNDSFISYSFREKTFKIYDQSKQKFISCNFWTSKDMERFVKEKVWIPISYEDVVKMTPIETYYLNPEYNTISAKDSLFVSFNKIDKSATIHCKNNTKVNYIKDTDLKEYVCTWKQIPEKVAKKCLVICDQMVILNKQIKNNIEGCI